MDAQEAAQKFDGNQYGSEGSEELFKAMHAAGIVALFGYSDDNVELRGAVDDEIGANNGTVLHFDRLGLLANECDNDKCPHYLRAIEKAPTVHASYDGVWRFKTKIPHATFKVFEDGELYCEGITFALADVPKVAP